MTELAKRGVLATAVCSTPFEKLGRNQARVLGVPDLPLLMIPHPLGGISMDVVKTRADIAAEQLIALLKDHLK